MYPFVPRTSLPWTMGDSSVFRVRTLSDWLTQNSTVGAVETGGLSSGSVVNTSQYVVIPLAQAIRSCLCLGNPSIYEVHSWILSLRNPPTEPGPAPLRTSFRPSCCNSN